MTGKEIEKAIVCGEDIDSEEIRKIVWIMAVTEEDVEKAAAETGRDAALRGANRELFLKKIRQDNVQQELKKKIRRKVRGAVKKYLPVNDTLEVEEEKSWSFLGCDFPDQID